MTENTDFTKRMEDIREMEPGAGLWALLGLLMDKGAKVEISLANEPENEGENNG